jgi:hypothetical protein
VLAMVVDERKRCLPTFDTVKGNIDDVCSGTMRGRHSRY